MKGLGINLMKYKTEYTVNSKVFLREILKDLNKWKVITCLLDWKT
jgi:hypothetical protein